MALFKAAHDGPTSHNRFNKFLMVLEGTEDRKIEILIIESHLMTVGVGLQWKPKFAKSKLRWVDNNNDNTNNDNNNNDNNDNYMT